MKVFFLLIFITSNSFSSEFIWSQIQEHGFKQFKDKEIIITGIIKNKKRHIRARDTFYTFDLFDPGGDNYIRVKLYSIKRLRMINDFQCGNESKFTLKARVILKKKNNGFMEIKSENKSLNCQK